MEFFFFVKHFDYLEWETAICMLECYEASYCRDPLQRRRGKEFP